MSKLIDLTGHVFGFLTVLEKSRTINGQPHWKCRCLCQEIVDISGHHLRSGKSKSCGCKRAELIKESKYADLPASIQRQYEKSLAPCMRKAGICFHSEKCYHHKFDKRCIAAQNGEGK